MDLYKYRKLTKTPGMIASTVKQMEGVKANIICQIKAHFLLTKWCDLTISMCMPWSTPHVAVDEEGSVVFEWWCKETKKLTIYVNEDSVEFVKVWGIDMVNEMEEGLIENNEDFRLVWKWLH